MTTTTKLSIEQKIELVNRLRDVADRAIQEELERDDPLRGVGVISVEVGVDMFRSSSRWEPRTPRPEWPERTTTALEDMEAIRNPPPNPLTQRTLDLIAQQTEEYQLARMTGQPIPESNIYHPARLEQERNKLAEKLGYPVITRYEPEPWVSKVDLPIGAAISRLRMFDPSGKLIRELDKDEYHVDDTGKLVVRLKVELEGDEYVPLSAPEQRQKNIELLGQDFGYEVEQLEEMSDEELKELVKKSYQTFWDESPE